MDLTDLAFAGIARQAELIRDGEIAPRELAELYLERIERIDPQLNAIRVVFAERALLEADQAAARLGAGADAAERPLLGVPVLIKDDVDVAGEITAYGSSASSEEPAAADAEVVRRLRAAGAVVLGKTHVPELMQWPFTESARFGATRNPWDLDRSPGGSSGGSGAAVAAGLAGAAIGTDGAGSIRIPAGCCALFGLKPQRGRVPEEPKHDPWQGLSVTGGLARTVQDAALFLDAIADNDGEPFAQAAAREPGPLRIGVTTASMLPGAPLGAEPRAALEETVELLRGLGHAVEPCKPPFNDVILEAATRYLRGIRDDARELPHPERLERRTKGMVRMGGAIPPAVVRWVRERERNSGARINVVFNAYDVLLTPLLTALPLPIGRYEGRGALWTFNGVTRFVPHAIPWNITGQPAASVPAGFTADGVPRCVQLVVPAHGEGRLLSLAAQIEAARPWADRRPPIAA